MFCFFFYFIGPIFPPDFRFGTKSRQFSEDASAYWGWNLEEFLLFFFVFKKNLSAGPRELRHGACRCYQFIHGSGMVGLSLARALRYLVQSSPTPFSSPPLNPSSWLRSTAAVVLLTFPCAREKFEKINQHESWRRRRHTRKKKKLENHHSGRFRC